ncbi:MAG: F-box protein [Verrucomicrobiota bacterium]|nr:F-box protein [Verrucomicrobiota bacterium]
MNTSTAITPYSNPALQTSASPSGAMGVEQESKKRTVSILSLPDSLFHQIFTYLTTRDLARCNYTCRVMSTEVAAYTTKYRAIWNPTLLTIANPVSELARAILNKTITNHVKIARRTAGMPKAVKQEIANEISQKWPPSQQKAKALTLLEAQADQFANALYFQHASTALSTAARLHDQALLNVAKAMVERGVAPEEILNILTV